MDVGGSSERVEGYGWLNGVCAPVRFLETTTTVDETTTTIT